VKKGDLKGTVETRSLNKQSMRRLIGKNSRKRDSIARVGKKEERMFVAEGDSCLKEETTGGIARWVARIKENVGESRKKERGVKTGR